jgi:hypothetical protein
MPRVGAPKCKNMSKNRYYDGNFRGFPSEYHKCHRHIKNERLASMDMPTTSHTTPPAASGVDFEQQGDVIGAAFNQPQPPPRMRDLVRRFRFVDC